MCMCVTVCHMCIDVLRGQKTVLNLTDLEKQVVVSAVIYFFHSSLLPASSQLVSFNNDELHLKQCLEIHSATAKMILIYITK